MFENVIALFIKRYLARYFDLNADQLSTQLLYKQQIIIENLTLNQTTLNDDIQRKFKLPIQIQSFHIDKIQCSFVLSSLFFRSSSPALIIRVEGVHAVIQSATIDDDQSSCQTSTENEAIKKQNQLDLAEQQLEKEFECFGEVKSSRWNVQRLLMSFLEKLQIDILDVHISYQSSALYTIGFTCQSIHIANKSSDETISQQVLRVINPGLYIDATSSSAHSYILSPSTSMEIYLTHNHFLVQQKEYRYELECTLNDLTMKCTVEQVRILADMMRFVQSSSLRHMLLSDSSRPRLKISKQSAKVWWRYAILTVLRRQATGSAWFDRTLFIDRLHRLITYQRLYRLYLDNKYFQCANFSPQNELAMTDIEREFDIEHLLIIRRSIFQTRISEQSMPKKRKARWYSMYATWITTKVIDLWEKGSTAELNENDLKLQEQVNTFIAESLEDEDLSESCQNALIFRVKFVLNSVQVDLSSSNNDVLFCFCLRNLSVLTEFRLRHRSIRASVCLEDICMRDQGQVDAFANILSSKGTAPVFELSLEKKERSKQSVYSIAIRSCGLCIVCSSTTMERLHHIYGLTFGMSSQPLSLSLNNWKQVKTYVVKNVTSMLERIIPAPSRARNRRREKKKYLIDVNIGAPKIVIPLASQGALIVDLGSVILSNDILSAKQPSLENDDEEEFLTPDSSPLANDMPLEEEMTYYSLNTIPTDIEYSSFSLSVCDIQVEYSVDLSPIVEKFSVHFVFQHPLGHLWPFVNISGTIQKLILHLSPQGIQSLGDSVHPWIVFINGLVIKQHYTSDVWPVLDFRLDEVSMQLNDNSQALCDIRMQNIDLSLIPNHPSKKLIFTLQTLAIFDLLSRTNLMPNTHGSAIRVAADFSNHDRSLIVDVNAGELDFVFNPKLICALMNFLLDIKPPSWSGTNVVHCTIKSTFRQLHLLVVHITSMLVSIELHLQNVSLNVLPNHLSMKMASVSYSPSLHVIDTAQFTHPTLTMDLDTLNISFPVGITLQLDPIRISNSHDRSSEYQINIGRMEMRSSHATWPLLENVVLSLDLQMSDTAIKINSQMISPLRIYLSQHRIKMLQQILETPLIRTTSSLPPLAFHLCSTQMSIIFQADRPDQVETVCEGTLNHCQMTLEIDHLQKKTIALQLDSLQINESIIVLTSIALTSHLHEQINIRLTKISIEFDQTTWLIISEIMRIIDSVGIQHRKNQPKEISITVDSISCLFRDNGTSLMSIDVQRFRSIVSSTIHGELGFISIRDLTTIDQLYSERLHTTGTDAIVFTFTREEKQDKIDLRLTSIQYIHTQDFLLHLIDYFNRFRSVIPQINRRFSGILLDINMDNMVLILPQQITQKPVLIFQLGHINFHKQSDLSASMKDIELYSSSHCSIDEGSAPSIRFSNFGFHRTDNELTSLTRIPFHLNLKIERNAIKIDLSTLDILFDFNHYQLLENIFIYNLNNLFKSLAALKGGIPTEFTCIVEIEHVGLDLLKFDQRRPLGCATLNNLHLSLDQDINGNQEVHLLCSTMKLIDTRIQHEHMIIPLSIPTNTSQLEIRLLRTKTDNECTITMNGARFLVVIDWLLALNEFLNLFCERSNTGTISLPIGSFEFKFHLNRFELVLVPSTQDPYSSALVYSSTMMMNYRKGVRPLECLLTDFTFFTCQIGNIDETIVPIIEPTDCSFTIQPSHELLDQQICNLNIPILNIRLSYSDVQMIYSLIDTIVKQISQAKTRKPLLTLLSSILTSPLRTLQSSATTFLDIKFLKFLSDQICLCLIDDCFGVNIPLLNIHLKSFLFHTIENSQAIRTDQGEFDLIISYYNRFQSGFEPLIELCPLQMTISRSESAISLFISSNEILNLNFTKAMYRLLGTIKKNWLADYRNTKKTVAFRRVKPLDPYCFKNLLGVQIKFRTWLIAEQRFSSLENIVDNNQTVSFCFPTHSSFSRKQRSNSVVASLFQSDRRLSISIDGWEPLQPISIDRMGTFFRLARPSKNHQSYKPILVIVDIAMTDSSIRSITIRSSMEIRNQLLTSIDLHLTTQSGSAHEVCLEPNETRSLPIQLCATLQQIRLRPANFALDYCDESIHWSEIERNSSVEENTIIRRSFLRSCSIDEKDAVYYVCLQSKQTCLLTYSNQSLSFYQLTILPPLTICNLLPCALTCEIPSYPQKSELSAYETHREHTVNIRQSLDILFSTSLYRMHKALNLPTISDFHQRVIFYDHNQRELMVDVSLECAMEHCLKLSVSVPYVLLNKSGIPLIFKDTNTKVEAAGQSINDESVVNREPLLFSFDNSNRSNTCVMRVGSGLHHHQDGRSQWSERFSIEHGSTHRSLQVRSPRSASDWNYSIGIDVRPGQGQLKKIKFIFLSARYIICNQCSYDLLIAQRSLKDDDSNHLRVSQHATVAYHWPQTDMEQQQLCVRAMNSQQDELVNWSGGFRIDCAGVVHINMRYVDGQCLILRVQVIERNGTYFIVFMDSHQMPPLFRIVNRSDLPILFYQSEIREEFTHLRTILSPRQSIDYTWDEPTLKPLIICSIPDGTKATYDLLKLGAADDLSYHNYIYLAFQETYSSSHPLVIEYTNKRLFLAKQQENKRSQLWQMTSHGLLIQVEASPAPQESNKRKESLDSIRQALVLDIEDLTDALTVRRYDPKRAATQTWQWLDSGYLCLVNAQLCVQVFGELKENSNVMLGPIERNKGQEPLGTMHICSHQRYRGSGLLSVRVIADGPTNVLEIDHEKKNELLTTPTAPSSSSPMYHLDLHFPAGVGVSVVGSIGYEAEELIYVLVNNLHIEYSDKNRKQLIDAKIDTLLISNQLLTTIKPCFLYTGSAEDSPVPSAIRLQINWQKFKNNFTLLHLIHSLHLTINTITIQLEEILLWKLIDFFDIEIASLSSLLCNAIGIGNTSNTDRRMDLNVNDYETERILSLLTSTQASRIYFHHLYLSTIDLNLSVNCIQSKRSLSPHLLAIKRRAPFPLVPFENAHIHLKSYEQRHISNTYDFFLLSILTYYANVCKRQVFKIIGSVDFLGNPLGFIHDVTDGFTCLRDRRGVSGLMKNVAHGVADSTSKVTGSLSHGIGKLVPDRVRRQISIDQPHGATVGHVIRQGTAGLAAGFYGGLTSIIKQPYKGAVEDGVPGLVKGFAKGIVGTVSKPVVGILDFTTGMAMVIKEGSRSSNAILQNRIRLPRCPCNTLGLLQSYSIFDAQGHSLLHKMNQGNSTERYISRLTLSTINTPRHTDAMITTERVIVYRIDNELDLSELEIVNTYNFHTPIIVLPIGSLEDHDSSASIEIHLNSTSSNHRCDTFEQAMLFTREVQRAQDLFEEEKLIYTSSDDKTDDSDE